MRAPPSNVAEVSEAGPTLSRTTTSVIGIGPRETRVLRRRADRGEVDQVHEYRSAGRSRPPRSVG